MRYRVKDYRITIGGGNVYVHIKVPNEDFLVANPVKEAIRLIVDETAKVVFCSSMQKDSIVSVAPSSVSGYDVAIGFAIPDGKTIASTDLFTIEMDWGDTVEDVIPMDYAKETSVSYNIQQVGNMQGYLQNTIAKEATLGAAPIGSERTTVFQYLAAILDNIEGQGGEEETPEELPAGLADRVMLLLQHFGIAGSYEAEAKGGERTNNTVIDECKVRFQDAFNGLLPTGFTMPNSVTVDNLTYTGTTNS